MQVVGICPVDGQWLTTRTLSSCPRCVAKGRTPKPQPATIQAWGLVGNSPQLLPLGVVPEHEIKKPTLRQRILGKPPTL